MKSLKIELTEKDLERLELFKSSFYDDMDDSEAFRLALRLVVDEYNFKPGG